MPPTNTDNGQRGRLRAGAAQFKQGLQATIERRPALSPLPETKPGHQPAEVALGANGITVDEISARPYVTTFCNQALCHYETRRRNRHAWCGRTHRVKMLVGGVN